VTRHDDRLALDEVRPLARHEFEQIRDLAYRTFGLDLKTGKEELVSARLRRLVHSGGFRSYQEYYRSVLQDTSGASLATMIDALATNHTSFLREPDHFEYLRSDILPKLAGRESIDVWSAACSTGEEVWTLAMVLKEALPNRLFQITATDISRKALAFAERAEYPAERCRALPPSWLSRYFVSDGAPPVAWRVGPKLRPAVSFHRVNLLERYSWGRQFPVIFCRNVMIYFDAPTQEAVIQYLSSCLLPGGHLFIGHSESLTRVSHSLEYVKPAIYRRPEKR